MNSLPARRGFTLIEMLVATVISAVLMLAVLSVLAGISRDRKNLSRAQAQPHAQAVLDQLRWDLCNARTMQQSPDGKILVLIGHGGIDQETLTPTGRLTRVTYRCQRDGATTFLVREQHYLDDPVRPQPWRELVAAGVTSILATPRTIEISPADSAENDATLTMAELQEANANKGAVVKVPSRVGLQIVESSKLAGEEIWIK